MVEPFIFTPGTYKTRDGRQAVVLCTDAPGNRPVIGYVISEEGTYSSTWDWRLDGTLYGVETPGDEDLMPPVSAPERVVTWEVLDSEWDAAIDAADALLGTYGFVGPEKHGSVRSKLRTLKRGNGHA